MASSPEPILVRVTTPDDYGAIVEIVNSLNPEYPPLTVERLRTDRESRSSAPHGAFVAENCGTIIGDVAWFPVRHVAIQGAYRFVLRIALGRWHDELARVLYSRMLTALSLEDGARLYTQVSEGQSEQIGFLRAQGFAHSGYGHRASVLHVAEIDLDTLLTKAQTLEKEGIHIKTLAEVGMDDVILRRVLALSNDAGSDMPMAEAWQGESFEEWLEELQKPGSGPDTYWLAWDAGQVVGLAHLRFRGSGFAENRYTAVHRSHRGRGIAQLLKTRQIEWARHNGITRIITWNDASNSPMLAVNRRLGYKPLGRHIEFASNIRQTHPG